MKKKKTLKKKMLLILCLLLILLYSVQMVKTFSRYVYNNIKEFYFKSNNFYFNSDKLQTNKPIYNVANWSGVEDYVININMNSMQNNNVHCNSDINYNITYTSSSNIVCQLSKSSSTISTATNTDNFIVTITPQTALSTGDTVWVEITATSTYPYEKELSGRFNITIGNLGMSYNIEDEPNKQYLEFNVTNTLNFYTIDEAFASYNVGDKIDMNDYLNLQNSDKNKCHSMIITLTFDPTVVSIDMTSEAYLHALSTTTTSIDGHTYIDSITFKLDAISSKCVKFYKENSNLNYTYPNGGNTSIIGITCI